MPSVDISDLGRMRLNTVSFFLLAFIISTKLVQLVWNYLRQDFPVLPQLSFRKSMALVLVWGLMFNLVLVMISGARELLTPGAWEKVDLTYKLSRSVPEQLDEARTLQLERLRAILWQYAEKNNGMFPISKEEAGADSSAWRASTSGIEYIYLGGLMADRGATPLVYEPGIYGNRRMVLTTSGAIETWPIERIRDAFVTR